MLLLLLLLLTHSASLFNEIFYERTLTHIRTFTVSCFSLVSIWYFGYLFFRGLIVFFFFVSYSFICCICYVCVSVCVCFLLPYLRIAFVEIVLWSVIVIYELYVHKTTTKCLFKCRIVYAKSLGHKQKIRLTKKFGHYLSPHIRSRIHIMYTNKYPETKKGCIIEIYSIANRNEATKIHYTLSFTIKIQFQLLDEFIWWITSFSYALVHTVLCPLYCRRLRLFFLANNFLAVFFRLNIFPFLFIYFLFGPFTSLHLLLLQFFYISLQLVLCVPPFSCFFFSSSDFFTISFSIFSVATTTASPPAAHKKRRRTRTLIRYFISQFSFGYGVHDMNSDWNGGLKSPTHTPQEAFPFQWYNYYYFYFAPSSFVIHIHMYALLLLMLLLNVSLASAYTDYASAMWHNHLKLANHFVFYLFVVGNFFFGLRLSSFHCFFLF